MTKYYLAIDIGASSGRHILGYLDNGIWKLEEIHRFENGMIEIDGHLCWNYENLFKEILNGMKKCSEAGKIPTSMGIDTWGVDFVLLDQEDQRIGDSVGYRDQRTRGMDQEVYKVIPEDKLYARTGIQKAIFNTIYQLMSIKINNPENLQRASSFLMVPDYFHFLLTGCKSNEYTNATTGQLVHPHTKNWNYELIEELGLPLSIFGKIQMPGTELGELQETIAREVGFSCKVVLPATHDTASAVLAVPSGLKKSIYISSGTWSLMGVERKAADTGTESRQHNFTNEGGYQYRFRYLKNIMGLWMIQSVKKEWEIERGEKISFDVLCKKAEKEEISSIVDCNNDCFLAPVNMTKEIQKECRESGQEVPQSISQLAAVIYHSLAECYRNTLEEIQYLTGAQYEEIYIVGGGANADYLNRLTAKATKRTVFAGPTEATAIGNLMVQMIREKELISLEAARECVFRSFDIETY